MTAPRPDGKWAEEAVRGALAQAGLTAAAVDAVSAHGTGTFLNDAMEAELIVNLFGAGQPAVLALKGWIGHLASACGAVELALCLTALHSGAWPAVRNLAAPCQDGLNFLRGRPRRPIGTLLLQNFGFGGQNAALVIGSWKP